MRLATTLPPETPLRDVPAAVRRVERLGFDTVHVPETLHDSLSVALLALEHSSRIRVRTSMTLAFPRSPMVVAYAAWDLARFSSGRFQLGLATQVRGNIVGRFSMPWSDPAAQLTDYVRALRAIFAAFTREGPLRYEGTHYRFDRLQPYFNPGPLEVPAPEIFTGGVNRLMCELAGAEADGLVTHPTNSHPRFLRASVLPWLTAGAAAAQRVSRPVLVVGAKAVSAPDARSLHDALSRARTEMAFLWSTPAYRPTLALLGHEELGERLTALVRDQRWDELPAALPDDVLARIVPVATYAEFPAVIADWYGGLCDELSVATPADTSADDRFAAMLEAVRAVPAADEPAPVRSRS
ncbi:TIGR03617 family F420-dependent LLM class oxidoreductase [Geodermatophilus marinus]|uniref:TIGR03617 family F420-dependent LLM class oxidoreductase n=1 Tax=Geodermatophilus sp. LHW52908 TaxID=2303986 RepID=UPI000E3E99EE|nr:TIGR03617 family F420-dependent LLM class oxidoreductase [Geodermatophilus sp. LHW52908]RFU20511.1 TIGR03617 family F420-dependent LLM class oxidoreductase [Geodermatophilus sp. LHW52908]